jgi:enterochelin esterase family protein
MPKPDWTPDNPGHLMIADLARLLVDGLARSAQTTSAAGAGRGGRGAAPAPIKSYEVATDRRVTFRIRAPQAAQVAVAGDFAQGPQLLARGEDGVWSVTLGPLHPAIYSYTFRVNGVGVLDPVNPMIKQGEAGSSSMFEVPGDRPAPYDWQPVPHGTVHVNWYHSKTLDTPRRIDVYTPPGYETSRSTYPVLYLLHGSGDTETGWTSVGRADMILDNLIAAGKARPMIVVMPYGRARRDVYLGPIESQPDANLFEDDLLKDVVPFAEKLYRISGKADDRAIAGLSMGGGQAMRIGLHHLELFHAVGLFSAGVRNVNYEEQYKDLLADAAATNKKMKVLYIACGKTIVCLRARRSFTKCWTNTEYGIPSSRPKRGMCGGTGAITWRISHRNCSGRARQARASETSRDREGAVLGDNRSLTVAARFRCGAISRMRRD